MNKLLLYLSFYILYPYIFHTTLISEIKSLYKLINFIYSIKINVLSLNCEYPSDLQAYSKNR